MSAGDGFVVAGRPGYHARSAQTLLGVRTVDTLDLLNAVSQRRATWRFDLINGVTDERLGTLTPYCDPASISHDTSRVIPRDLRINLAPSDLSEINSLTDRILAYMTIAGEDWPLGRFMFAADSLLKRTRGDDQSSALTDEMSLVDREILRGFTATGSCDSSMRAVTDGLLLPMGRTFAASPYTAQGGWQVGSRRGNILQVLASQGDLYPPWMDNNGVMRSVRVISPEGAVPDLSFDDGYPVVADSITDTNQLLDAPNRFVVVGNGSSSNDAAIVGVYDLPASASHSIAVRGFAIQQTISMQITSKIQAIAIAKASSAVYAPAQEISVSTPPDPRHDGYQVIRYQDLNWLETAWSMTCEPGGDMTHTLRRNYV